MNINGIGVLTPEEEQCLIPLETTENALFSSGKDGVQGIYSTLDKKLELIEFDDKTEVFEELNRGITKRILFQGDSITDCGRSRENFDWIRDGVHPSTMGHELIKREWMKAFQML